MSEEAKNAFFGNKIEVVDPDSLYKVTDPKAYQAFLQSRPWTKEYVYWCLTSS